MSNGSKGTNTYLIGSGSSRILIDTGQGFPSWLPLLSSVLCSESTTISHALITHWHEDHVGGINDLLKLSPNTVVHKHSPTKGQNPITDGQVFKTEGASLRAFHCPGHTVDHVAFIMEEEDAMFTGDNVLGHGTAVFEDLATYLESLHRMRDQFNGRAYPGHGEIIADGKQKIIEYIEHRKQRENEVLQALKDVESGATPVQLVKVVYPDLNPLLHEAAAKGLVMILEKMKGEEKVLEGEEGRWSLSEKAIL